MIADLSSNRGSLVVLDKPARQKIYILYLSQMVGILSYTRWKKRGEDSMPEGDRPHKVRAWTIQGKDHP
jgi:hypothetical protein